jgi:hypothetical protein
MVLVFVTAVLVSMNAIAFAEAASSLSGRSFSTTPLLINPGARSSLDSGTKFHTNPGGKYVFRGQAREFHTNPGLKYVYPGYTAAP